MHKILMACIVLSVAGCSNKAVYDNIQHNNRQACHTVPPAQYEACIERSNKSYEEYRREREAVVEEE